MNPYDYTGPVSSIFTSHDIPNFKKHIPSGKHTKNY